MSKWDYSAERFSFIEQYKKTARDEGAKAQRALILEKLVELKNSLPLGEEAMTLALSLMGHIRTDWRLDADEQKEEGPG